VGLDLKLWRDRLRYGRSMMEQEGIIGKLSSGDPTMRLLIEFYRGKQWDHLDFPGISDDERVTANKVFQAANQLESEVSASRPDVQLLPRGGVLSKDSMYAASKAARAVQPLISYDIDELDMETQCNDALVDHFFAHFGCVRHGYTPREEVFEVPEAEGKRETRLNYYRHERPDRPWIRRIAPWDVIPDYNAIRLHPDGGMRWVAFRTIQTLAQIKANPNIKNREGLKDLAGNVAHPYQPLGPNLPDATADPDSKTYLEIYTVYEAETRTWFQITLDGPEQPLREQDDWPIDWEWLPVNFLTVNDQRDKPFSVPILASIRAIQEEMNLLRTQMRWLVGNLRRLVCVNDDGLADGEDRKLETAFITEILRFKGDPNELLKVIQTGGFPQELLAYYNLLDEEVRENLGLSKMGRGQRINVETATEASNVQTGQDVNVSRAVRKYEKFWKDVLTLYMQARRQTFDTDAIEVFPLVGRVDADGLQAWSRVSPEELHADLAFYIVPGSTRRRNRLEEERLWAARLETATKMPDVYNVAFYAQKLAEIQGVSPEEALQQFSMTAGAVRGLDQVRRTAQPGGEDAAGSGDGGAGNLTALFPQDTQTGAS
jgi:hypothetical protein